MRVALHLAQRRADDHLEPHVGRSRVPRQPEDGRALHDAERLRLAGSHVHGGHEQFAQVFHHRLDEVEIAVGGASARDDEIVVARRLAHHLRERLVRVLHDGQDGGHAARRLHARRQRVAVGVADLAGRGQLVGIHQFRADGGHRHARPAVGGHVQDAASGQKPDAGRADDLPRFDDDLARLRFLARFADVRPRLRRMRERHAASRLAVAGDHADYLVLHHGVGVVGHRRARHDAHALAGRHRPVVGFARRHFRDHVQLDGRVFGSRGQVGRAHGEPVHGRMGERRDVDVAAKVRRRHAPHGVEYRNRLDGQGFHLGKHQSACFFERYHVWHRFPFRENAPPGCATRRYLHGDHYSARRIGARREDCRSILA